ncbi:MAG: hypothetical protein ABSG84_06320 [Acidobacteriaceae bacterium]|jgi:hypothetical protein
MNLDRSERGLRALAGVPGALAMVALLCAPLDAQTHKVAQQQNVVRAVGVYEWTGDMAKPTASRLIPVSLFIDGKLDDAGVYLAQPVPFALLTGNVYELQKAGTPLGTLNLEFARHLIAPESATTTYDDGWFGYGRFVPPALEKKSTLKGTAVAVSLNGLDQDESAPHFSSRSATPGSGGAAKTAPGTASASTETPADDPDRPMLHRSAGTSDQTASAGGSGDAPADDADRPTLRRRTPEQTQAAKADQSNTGNSLNDDKNRPMLHRGKPEGTFTDTDIPKLSGLPGDQDLHQLAAVSDAADHPPHDFSRTWEGDEERQAILTKMEAAARTLLTAYETANAVAPATAPPPPPAKQTATSRVRHSAAKETPPPPPEPLLDEQLSGYTLSYGGAATFVYHAHTDGLGPMLRFVTLVAQVNMQGEPEIALKNVTDATHLDRTPRMRLVDAVDAEASNRASLLFELRAQNSRQFALYRVIGGQATQTFITGMTP